ncbi:putative polysaccharide biosynthesis protein [Paenibacillus massiliensis]|uniref:putative polysaccharide biosynthesis protein n=1 Tax=Paenibacillus massiliensis TaxID=225917 RepID=UPI00037C601F|nr:polysaccharide biosynthesis protein [Paenibacillus massiliensis]
MSKKESFIRGTLILAAAALVARVLGLVQRVPLEHMFGDVGNVAFTASNTVYLMLLTVATAGIPSTLSKMVSERYALNRPHEAARIYQAALLFAVGAGIIMTILLYVGAPYYATNVIKQPEAALAIRALAPALLLFPAIAMMRGYFQGRGNMTAGGISQIVEQFARVGVAILLGYMLVQAGYNEEFSAAGASFGGVIGSIGAFAVMLYFTFKLRREDRKSGTGEALGAPIPLLRIYKDIFTLSIPIVLSSLAVPAVYFIDTSILKTLLVDKIGEASATGALAVLGAKAQSVAGIPPILAIALSQSLLPVVSAAFARKDMDHLRGQMTLALRISILSGLPIVIALTTAAYSINGLLFKDLSGSGIIAALTLGTIFQITMMTSNSMLIGMGKPNISTIHVMVGLVVKLAASWILSIWFDVYGIIAATALCFLVITLLNIRVLKGIVPFSILGRKWPGLLVTVVISAAAGYGMNVLTRLPFGATPSRLVFFLACGVSGATVALAFVVLMILLRVITREELAGYPRIIQKLLRPLMRLQRGQAQSEAGRE